MSATATRYDYVIRPEGRLSAGRAGQAGNLRNAHSIVPGATVRGALGAAWWGSPDDTYRGADPQGDFDRLFADALCVGQALPVVHSQHGSATAVHELVPASFLVCKYAQSCGSAPVDLALLPLPQPQGVDAAQPTPCATTEGLCVRCEKCHTCDAAAEPGRGWVTRRPTNTLVTRTELKDGVPVNGQLFTREVLQADPGGELTLQGSIWLTKPVAPEVLDWLTRKRVIRLGGSLTTMGRCSIAFEQVPAATEPTPSPTGLVAFYLHSPAILLDDDGAATLDLESAALRVAQAAGATDCFVHRVFVRSTLVSGWHGVAGLPKPQEWAVDSGGVVVLGNLTPAALANVLSGIGIRRAEGYGQLSLDPSPQVHEGVVPDSPGLAEPPPAPVEPRRPLTPRQTIRQFVEQGRTDVAQLSFARAVKTQLGQTKRYYEHNGQALLDNHVERVLSLPWAKALSGPEREQLAELLRSPDAAAMVLELDQMLGTSQ